MTWNCIDYITFTQQSDTQYALWRKFLTGNVWVERWKWKKEHEEYEEGVEREREREENERRRQKVGSIVGRGKGGCL